VPNVVSVIAIQGIAEKSAMGLSFRGCGAMTDENSANLG
jgi:hypothetical protein